VSYRPITDIWILARAKLKGGRKYYGAYPGGFPERARSLLGVTINELLLHVCSGMAQYYPYAGGFGGLDRTLDLDPECGPDFQQDCLAPLPPGFKAMLADPPYSPDDADKYAPGRSVYPSPSKLVANMLAALLPGQRCGILHYIPPRPPANTRFVACVGVIVGFDNRLRCFSVCERGA
jgi:hypothetical protein